MTLTLDVYFHNVYFHNVFLQAKLVGKLHQKKSGKLKFCYDADYLNANLPGISLSLPPRVEAYEGQSVKIFFSGLLPDENEKQRLAAYLGLSEDNAFALLKEVGGDCAGALALYPEGQVPSASTNDNDVKILDDNQLKEILEKIKRYPMLAGEDGYRLSLAGAQSKLAVGFEDGRVQLMKGGAPTTHILKPFIGHIDDSAHNEFFCMKLAKRMGIDVPEVFLHFVNDTPYYLIERYDRQRTDDGTVWRIHQEDFCQALSIAPEMKYEREGGPSIAKCQALISRHTMRPAVDQLNFMNRVIFNYLIGNADAHGKNFSLLYRQKKPEFAPAYDMLSTAIYPDLSSKMAMKIGEEYDPQKVYLRHFYKTFATTKTAQNAFNKQKKQITDLINDEAVKLKQELERQHSKVFDAILTVIQQRSRHLQL
ncbi:type II toxin-antitoxin system HipA family toxin [Bartonella sp. A05]|uniref:type II toxin-antitoxin system HipA family toxin n=1 Tax=Bartonella sp. A05 TaxID=2967261 RepID=UPI0022A9304E|nr:type II toxin-antitoxin system HipA family toxin [Bartonella sp. A05]MCZ2203685.1 type II toxin-antitoxin system HipA family toxin [Bartonella sp. A05]